MPSCGLADHFGSLDIPNARTGHLRRDSSKIMQSSPFWPPSPIDLHQASQSPYFWPSGLDY